MTTNFEDYFVRNNLFCDLVLMSIRCPLDKTIEIPVWNNINVHLSLESVGGHFLGLGAPHQKAFYSSR
jgi:hypothetical protein